jgi:hypothetical protein
VNLKVPFVSEFLAKLMLTFAVTELDPLSVRVAGEIKQVEVAGPPLHASDTAPVNR